MSHLEEVTDAGIAAMSRANVVAVLLPTTQYILRIKCPPARKLIEKGTIFNFAWATEGRRTI